MPPAAEYDLHIRTDRLLSEVPLIDGHNDMPYIIRGLFGNHLNQEFHTAFEEGLLPGQTDLSRIKRGRLGGQFWSAFVPCPKEPDSPEQNLAVIRDTLQQLDVIHRIIQAYPQVLGLATTPNNLWEVFSSGRIASLLGIEGAHQLGSSLSVLRVYHTLGARYLTLTHTKSNKYAEACAPATSDVPGLSENGRRLVAEMNRIGMIIDLSHTSEATMNDTLDISVAPVIFSHSSCFALCPHPRNASDSVLHRLKQNGGLLMVAFVPNFLNSSPEIASLGDVIDHIVHVGKLIGYEHVGIGSDFDGMENGPRGLEDTSLYTSLITGLLERGLEDSEVKMVMGLNIIRVLGAVEEVSEQLKKSNVPIIEDEVGAVWSPEILAMVKSRMKKKEA